MVVEDREKFVITLALTPALSPRRGGNGCRFFCESSRWMGQTGGRMVKSMARENPGGRGHRWERALTLTFLTIGFTPPNESTNCRSAATARAILAFSRQSSNPPSVALYTPKTARLFAKISFLTAAIYGEIIEL